MVIRDIKGKLIVFLICSIILYSGVLQFGYLTIPNALLILGVLLIITIISDFSLQKKSLLVGVSSELKILGLYLIATFIFGCVMTPDIGMHISHGISIIEYFVVALAVYYYSVTRKNTTFLAWFYLILYSICVVIFIRSPQAVFEGTQIRYSLTSSMNVNSFSMGLTMATWATMYLISLKKINIIIGSFLTGVYLYSIVLTASRKGLIGALLCIVLWVFICYLPLDKDNMSLKRILKIFVITSVAVTLILVIAPKYLDSYMAVRMKGLSSQSDLSTLARIDLYKSGIEYIKWSPILGHGFWGFSYYYGVYSHATIIEVPVSSGIPLAVIYFGTYFVTFRNFIRNKRKVQVFQNQELYNQKVSLAVGLVLFLLMCFYALSVIHIYELSSYVAFAYIYSVNDITKKIVRSDEIENDER